jgi:hypothetical protein
MRVDIKGVWEGPVAFKSTTSELLADAIVKRKLSHAPDVTAPNVG